MALLSGRGQQSRGSGHADYNGDRLKSTLSGCWKKGKGLRPFILYSRELLARIQAKKETAKAAQKASAKPKAAAKPSAKRGRKSKVASSI